MLTKREWRILQLLYESEDFLTAAQIAQDLEVSERTIRTYLKNLEAWLLGKNARLTYKYGQGVRLDIQSSKFHQLYEQSNSHQNSPILEEGEDRLHYMLNQLFFEDEQVNLKALGQLFHVSKSSINQLLGQIRQRLKDYDLEVVRIAPSSYKVSGQELKKRQFIADYFLAKPFKEVLLMEVRSQKLLEELDISSLTEIILQECRQGQIRLSDFTLTNLLLHLSLSILRQQSGHGLKDFIIEERVFQSPEYQVAQAILNRLENQLSLTFPKGETQNLALHLLTKSQHQEDYSLKSTTFVEDLTAVLKKIDKDLNSQLSNDYLLLEALIAHLGPLLLRLKYGIRLENPLLDDIKQEYASIFEVTKSYFSHLNCLVGHEVRDDEWAYITLHLLAAFDRQVNQKAIKVLVVCATGIGSAQVLRHRLEGQFGQRIQIVDCISYHELSDRHLETIDMIISSIDLGSLIFKIPVVLVSVFLNVDDKTRLTIALDSIAQNQSLHLEKEQLTVDQELVKSFDTCCSEQQFLVLTDSIEKEELIKKMLGQLDEVTDAQRLEGYYHQVELREQLNSTAFSDLIAVPHFMEAQSERAQIVVAIIKSGVVWDDGHRDIKMVFLLSPSRHRNQDLKRLSHYLARWVDRDDLVEHLLSSPSYQNFRQLFLNTSIKEDR